MKTQHMRINIPECLTI